MNAWDSLQRMKARRMQSVVGVLSRPKPQTIEEFEGRAPPPPPVPEPKTEATPTTAKKGMDAATALRMLAQVPKESKPKTEADRILELPEWSPESFQIDLTDELKLPHGTERLKTIQSVALHWIRQTGGLLGPLAVGSGKTHISLLAPVVLKAQRPVLLVPPTMQVPLYRAMEHLKDHWRLPDNLAIVPYSQLSVAKSTALFDELQPDLIVCDEAHCIRHESAARTKRVLRYARNYPNTKFVFLSGTLTSRGLRDYAHLAELALKKGSPVPLEANELLAWAACLDADGKPRGIDWDMYARFHDVRDAPEEEQRTLARARFRERFVRTPGVVATTEGSVEASLLFRKREVELPLEVQDAIQGLRKTWKRPDGEELQTALDYWRCSTQMAQGFYYYWDWPNGEVDEEWLGARAFWHKMVRNYLQESIVNLDSPLLVYNAVRDGRIQNPAARAAWEGWVKVKDRPNRPPPTATTWLSEFIVSDAIEWMKENPGGIVWQSDKAIEQAFRRRGVRVFGQGETPPDDEDGMVLSVTVHGAGHNLQKHNHNLILNFPSSGKTAEQLIGRTHRYGQLEDEVYVDYYAPTPEAISAILKARADARYIEETMKSPQKLLYGTWVDDPSLMSSE